MRDSDLELTPEEVAAARAIFEGREEGRSGCVHCAGIHDQVRGVPSWRQPCPRVKHAVWHADGTLLEVEYWPRSEWIDAVIFPCDVYNTDDIGGGD